MTGKSTPYDDDDYTMLVLLLDKAFRRFGAGDPDTMWVKADIEWAGDYNRVATRATTMNHLSGRGLNSRVRPAVAAAMAAYEAVPKPYTVARPNIPVTFSGQLNWLTKTQAGRAHAETAGFHPAPQTLRRWKNGTQKPSARSRAALEEAGQRYHDQRVSEWEQRRDAVDAQRSAAANRFYGLAQAAGDRLTAALSSRYGSEIRLFEPDDPITFDR